MGEDSRLQPRGEASRNLPEGTVILDFQPDCETIKFHDLSDPGCGLSLRQPEPANWQRGFKAEGMTQAKMRVKQGGNPK